MNRSVWRWGLGFDAGKDSVKETQDKIRVCHIITSLDTGGAEMMLFKLLSQHDRSRFAVHAISLLPMGEIGKRIAALEIPVCTLDMPRGVPSPAAVLRLKRWLREIQPDVVQTWMYHADLMGGLAARLAGYRNVLWNIRHSTFDPGTTKRTTLLTARLCARLSRRLPKRILCCSTVARESHTAIGYAGERFTVIPNGFDLQLFRPCPEARSEVRCELGLPTNAPLIGLVARWHPQKDHETFVRAAGNLHRSGLPAHFVLCGSGMDAENGDLNGWIAEEGLQSYFHLLGRRDDMPRLTAAFDLAASSSAFGEAFPNVLGEAMACGVPCAATDVGDSAFIVGDTGRIVRPRDPEALAKAWQEVLCMSGEERRELGARARCRVQAEFNLPEIVSRYENLYEEMARPCAE